MGNRWTSFWLGVIVASLCIIAFKAIFPAAELEGDGTAKIALHKGEPYVHPPEGYVSIINGLEDTLWVKGIAVPPGEMVGLGPMHLPYAVDNSRGK